MADIDLNFIGTQLRRLQNEVGELRYTVDRQRMERATTYEAHAQHIDKALAELGGNLSARMDAFDQRFVYLDELISQTHQDVADLRLQIVQQRQELTDLRLEVNRQGLDVTSLRQEMTDLRLEVTGLRLDMNDRFQDMNNQFRDMNSQFAELKTMLAGRAV